MTLPYPSRSGLEATVSSQSYFQLCPGLVPGEAHTHRRGPPAGSGRGQPAPPLTGLCHPSCHLQSPVRTEAVSAFPADAHACCCLSHEFEQREQRQQLPSHLHMQYSYLSTQGPGLLLTPLRFPELDGKRKEMSVFLVHTAAEGQVRPAQHEII